MTRGQRIADWCCTSLGALRLIFGVAQQLCKHDTLNQRCINAGPASANVGSMYRLCREKPSLAGVCSTLAPRCAGTEAAAIGSAGDHADACPALPSAAAVSWVPPAVGWGGGGVPSASAPSLPASLLLPHPSSIFSPSATDSLSSGAPVCIRLIETFSRAVGCDLPRLLCRREQAVWDGGAAGGGGRKGNK